MTIGDVLAVIAAILTIAGAWGSVVLLVSLLFPTRCQRAQSLVVEKPRACAGRGLGVSAVFGFISLLLATQPNGPIKLLAGVIVAGLGMVAAIGSAGIVLLMSERIETESSPLYGFAARTRAAFLYVAAGLLPIIGWFLITPAALFVALGAGTTVIASRRAAKRNASPATHTLGASESFS